MATNEYNAEARRLQKERDQQFILHLYRELHWHERGRPRSRMDREGGWSRASDSVIDLILQMIDYIEGQVS